MLFSQILNPKSWVATFLDISWGDGGGRGGEGKSKFYYTTLTINLHWKRNLFLLKGYKPYYKPISHYFHFRKMTTFSQFLCEHLVFDTCQMQFCNVNNFSKRIQFFMKNIFISPSFERIKLRIMINHMLIYWFW